jgi:translocation and assembly module TamB
MSSETRDPDPTTPARPRPVQAAAWTLAMALLAVALVAATAWWMATTTSGLRFAARMASTVVPGLSLRDVEGSLVGGLHVGRFSMARASWSVEAEDLSITPHDWRLASRELDIERAAARRVSIDWTAGGGPAKPPASLALPIDLIVRNARIDELQLGARGARPLVFRNVALAGRMDGHEMALQSIGGVFDRSHLQGAIRIGATAPFPLDARASLTTALQGRELSAAVTGSGSLERLQLALSADDPAARAQASATLQLFADVPLERLTAQIDAFDPALWIDGIPAMQLTARVELVPEPDGGGAFALAGPFSADNAAAGPLDRNRLPVRAVRGTLRWAAETLNVNIERADGVRGSAAGALRWSEADGAQASLRFSGIDASTLHSSARPTDISGALAYALQAGEQKFSGSARNGRGLPLQADFDATLKDAVLDLVRARLRLGAGSAELHGRIELAGLRALRLQGRFADLDLAQLVPGIDTRLNGTIDIDGRLADPMMGQARFALAESRIAGRPITGSGLLHIDRGRIDADVQLRSGEARLNARGGLGAGRQLQVDLAAPDLALLVPGYGGAVTASLTLAGEPAAARIAGHASATTLRVPGNHRIAAVLATFSGGLRTDEPLAISVELSGHSAPGGPGQSLAGARLIGRGTTGEATYELVGATAAGEPVRMIARGGFRDDAWQGAIEAVQVGAPIELLMRSPAPLVIASRQMSFGPADFEVHGTRLREFQAARSDGGWRTSGRFEGLQPQALDVQARAPRRVVRAGTGERVPLTLAGRWSLAYTDSVSGIAVVERTGGDLYSGIDALSPIGVSDVGAALNVLRNRVTGNVYVRGRALGSIDVAVDAFVDPTMRGGRVLAQDEPFSIVVDAALPDLSWIGPLIGGDVQFAGRGTVKAAIGGTPADPTSTGAVRGEALRLAWVEQAVRLENGTLDAALENGVLVLNQLLFSGTPRVPPGDLRALEGLSSGRPFEVRAVGRVALSSLTGSIGVQATQLPVLQRADRWMVVSGTGGITLSPQRAELYAKLTVDGAYINFAGARAARSLPADVAVKRPGKAKQAAPTPPVDVTLDVQGELGPRFYIEGAGLEARLEGALNVTGRPSLLRGEGSVRAVDGVYAGYGQRLTIQRGIVTFQGPIDNPALNVLAVRAGLPVEVGVAISGTAQRPFVRLYSDPSMSDTEKLNWLVLGRPPGAGDGNDRALLSAAASALFSGQADRASTNLMRSLGIDQITLQPGQSSGSLLPRETVAGRLRSSGVSSTASADFLAVGKRINDDLFLSFEQALTGAEYFVALNYRLTRQLSLIARAGSTNALDLVYSIAFD